MVERRRVMAGLVGATLASGAWARNSARAAGPAAATTAGPGKPLPEFAWTAADGTPRSLADHRGQGVVLNLWATWCVPCVAEMPSLDTLAGLVAGGNGGKGVVVLPLSSDRAGAAAVERFYARTGVKHLPVLLDPRGAAARALGVPGIPTTLLIDAAGLERGRVEGGADWGSETAVRMVRALAL